LLEEGADERGFEPLAIQRVNFQFLMINTNGATRNMHDNSEGACQPIEQLIKAARVPEKPGLIHVFRCKSQGDCDASCEIRSESPGWEGP